MSKTSPMNRVTPLLTIISKKSKLLYNTIIQKNQDYTGDNASPFANFETSAQEAGITVPQGIISRFSDKYSRLRALLRRPPAVVEESIEDTLMDMHGYLYILEAWLDAQKQPANEATQENVDTPAQ